MPQFEYKAFDASGLDHSGTIEATHANEAVRTLAGRGLRVQKVNLVNQASVPYGAAPAYHPTTAVAAPSYAQSPPIAINRIQPGTQVANAAAPSNVFRTKPAKDSDLFFIFSQLANLIRAGITPSEAFSQLATRNFHAQYADAFRQIAQLTAAGKSMADAMESAPDIFTPGNIGAVRAGETGGYLWQACEQVALHMQSAMSLRRFYYFSLAMFWGNVIPFPLVWAGTRGIDSAIAAVDQNKSPLVEMGHGLMAGLLGLPGILSVLLALAVFLGRQWGRQTAQRRLRHSMALSTPVLSKRNRAEGLQVFSYHMSELSKAGISPYRAWKLAAAAIPNMVQAEDLLQEGGLMNESTPASRALYGSKSFPQEFAAIVETGELTGNVSQAMDQTAEVNRRQIQIYDAAFKTNAVVWIFLINFAFAALGYAFILRGYFDSMFKHILNTE